MRLASLWKLYGLFGLLTLDFSKDSGTCCRLRAVPISHHQGSGLLTLMLPWASTVNNQEGDLESLLQHTALF